MAEVKFKTPTQRLRERVARMKKLHQRPGIRVEPVANGDIDAETMRRLLKHPRAGAFRSEGSLEWPDDGFTNRRLRDGDIKRVDGEKKEAPARQQQHRA